MDKESRIGRIPDTCEVGRRSEMARLYGLHDRFLGRALVTLGRAARDGAFERTPGTRSSYPVFLVWDVVPEIASRLGETVFLPGEREGEVKKADCRTLREWAWNCLRHSPPDAPTMRDRASWHTLRGQIDTGNPVFIALDRLCPVTASDIATDAAAAQVYRSGLARGMLHPNVMWRP